MDVLTEIRRRLSNYSNLYDSIRIIDPIRKLVLQSYNCEDSTNNICFALWGRDSICDNCVSMRALHEKDTIYKVECTCQNKIVSVVATSIEVHHIEYQVELIKVMEQNDWIENKTDQAYLYGLIQDMNKKSITDELTGMYNYRYLTERLPVELNRHFKLQQPCTLVLLEIDNLTLIGSHQQKAYVGQLLCDYTRLLQEELKGYHNWVARCEDDKVFIFIHTYEQQDIYLTIKEFQQKIEKTIFVYEDQKIQITTSVGMIETSGTIACQDEIIDRLYEAQYLAKKDRTNRIYRDSYKNYK